MITESSVGRTFVKIQHLFLSGLLRQILMTLSQKQKENFWILILLGKGYLDMISDSKFNQIVLEDSVETTFFSTNSSKPLSSRLFRLLVTLAITSLFAVWTTGYLRLFTYFLFFAFCFLLVKGAVSAN